MAGEAEERAKKANKSDPARRGHLDCFGQPVAWDELGALVDWAVKLNSDIAEGRVSHQLAYSWLGLYRQYRRESDPARAMRYKPLLAYRLRKEEYARSKYQGLLDHQNSLWRHVPVWVQWGLYLGR
jgi:CRISPR-associated protein Csm1